MAQNASTAVMNVRTASSEGTSSTHGPGLSSSSSRRGGEHAQGDIFTSQSRLHSSVSTGARLMAAETRSMQRPTSRPFEAWRSMNIETVNSFSSSTIPSPMGVFRGMKPTTGWPMVAQLSRASDRGPYPTKPAEKWIYRNTGPSYYWLPFARGAPGVCALSCAIERERLESTSNRSRS